MRVAELDLADSALLLIPCELDTRGRAPGAAVLIEDLESGELRIVPAEQVRDRIRDIERRVVGGQPEASPILAEAILAASRPAGSPGSERWTRRTTR